MGMKITLNVNELTNPATSLSAINTEGAGYVGWFIGREEV